MRSLQKKINVISSFRAYLIDKTHKSLISSKTKKDNIKSRDFWHNKHFDSYKIISNATKIKNRLCVIKFVIYEPNIYIILNCQISILLCSTFFNTNLCSRLHCVSSQTSSFLVGGQVLCRNRTPLKRTSLVSSLYKKNSALNKRNYRPVSMLPILSKL